MHLAPLRGERSDCEAIRVRGPLRDPERSGRSSGAAGDSLRSSSGDAPHPNLLPARGEKEQKVQTGYMGNRIDRRHG